MKKEKKPLGKAAKKKPEKKKQERAKAAPANKELIEQCVQMVVPVREYYENGLIELEDGSFALVAAFTNCGYLSRTEREKERKYEIYRKILQELPRDVHYQEIIYNVPVDYEAYKAAVASQASFKDEYEEAFFAVQDGFCQKARGDVSLKKFLLILSVKEPEDGSTPYNRLLDLFRSLQRHFAEMQSELFLLSWEGVLQEIYHAYHPFSAAMPPLAGLYRHGLSMRDITAPDGLKFTYDYCRLGDDYMRIMSVRSYGSDIRDSLIYDLLNHKLTFSVVKHIDHISKDDALKQLDLRLQDLEAKAQGKKAKNKRDGGDYVAPRLLRNIEELNAMQNDLLSGEECIRQTLYLVIYARSMDELIKNTARAKAIASAQSLSFATVHTGIELKAALNSILPIGRDEMQRFQTMLAGEAAVATPFSYESYFDKNGFFYGYNEHNGEMNIINRKTDKSAGGFVFGVVGSGKGMWVKNEMSNILYQPFCRKDRLIVIDAADEYIPLAQAAGGAVTRLEAHSGDQLDPMWISRAQEMLVGREAAVANKSQAVIAFISRLKSGPLSAEERGIIDEAVLDCFRRHKNPVLKTLYECLGSMKGAGPLLSILRMYVEGSVTLFNGRNKGKETERFQVFSVKKLPQELRDAAMLVLLDRIENMVMENYSEGIYTWVYCDEMHRYFNYERSPYTAERFSRAYSEWRKYGAIITGITQLPSMVIASEDGSTMLSNSRFVAMAELDERNIQALETLYQFNEEQRRTLTAPGVGSYVLRCHNQPMSLRLLYPGAQPGEQNQMYELFSTNFNERADQA